MPTRNSGKGFRTASLAASVLAAGVAHHARADGTRPAAALSVELPGLRSNDGRVGCTLYDGPRGFPTDAAAALQQRWCPIQGQASTCAFDPIPRGTYAVACFHDENGNGKLDRNLLGIPKEGTAASNGAKGTFGPPKYEDAKFDFSGEATKIVLRVSY